MPKPSNHVDLGGTEYSHLGHFRKTKHINAGHNTITRVGGGYEVRAEHGSHRNLGGPYRSKAEAVKRLRQVEYFKHKG